MAPASVFSLALVIYTGFAIPIRYMRPWLRWLNYLNPVGYAFEALMINEVSLPKARHFFQELILLLVPQSKHSLLQICSARLCLQ
jgi:ABC-type multidrug transport system permease subunit